MSNNTAKVTSTFNINIGDKEIKDLTREEACALFVELKLALGIEDTITLPSNPPPTDKTPWPDNPIYPNQPWCHPDLTGDPTIVTICEVNSKQ